MKKLLLILGALPLACSVLLGQGPRGGDLELLEVAVPTVPNPWNWGLSPDGKTIAYVAPVNNAANAANLGAPRGGRGGVLSGLWIRSVDKADDRMLPGTEDAKTEAAPPFWSPDGKFIAFPAHDGALLQLKKVALAGGPPEVITTLGPRGTTMRRGVWNTDGFIIFANDIVRRVSASGGPVTTITALEPTLGEQNHSSPWLLPDGKHFLFKAWSNLPQNRKIYIGELNTAVRTLLLPDANSRAMFADGFILYTRQGTLLAQPFDIEKMQFKGDAVTITQNLLYDQNLGITGFDVSKDGTLIYRPALPGTSNPAPTLTVVRNWTILVKR